MGIEHLLAPPRHPQKNGMVERFNGSISELLQQTRFDCHVIGAKTAIQALKEWQQKQPELFMKRVYD